MQVHISVNETDIKEGVKFDCKRCPVARAAYRAFEDVLAEDGSTLLYLTVGSSHLIASIYTDETTVEYTIPITDEPKDWISDFDFGMSMLPISFDIETGDGVIVRRHARL